VWNSKLWESNQNLGSAARKRRQTATTDSTLERSRSTLRDFGCWPSERPHRQSNTVPFVTQLGNSELREMHAVFSPAEIRTSSPCEWSWERVTDAKPSCTEA
jgi:hypothetical protein